MQASQNAVVWTVVICAVILLVAGVFGVNYMNNQNALSVNNVGKQIDNKIDDKFDSALSELQTATSNLQNIQVPDVEVDPEICDNIDGCNGWRLPAGYRFASVGEVTEELTENDNRELFRHLVDLFDIDEKDDIDDVSLHAIGRVRSNEELDTDFDFSDSMTIYVEYVLRVDYFEDGNNDDTKTKYIKVTAQLTELEDGIDGSEVEILSVVPWRADKALETN